MLRAVLAAFAAALLAPLSAEAALSFAFDRAQARSGRLVHAFQAGADGIPAPAWDRPEGVSLYLASVRNTKHRVLPGRVLKVRR